MDEDEALRPPPARKRDRGRALGNTIWLGGSNTAEAAKSGASGIVPKLQPTESRAANEAHTQTVASGALEKREFSETYKWQG
jgi:hypothetical protein